MRRVRVQLKYDNSDITADIAPMLLSFTYTDQASGSADDISITLEDTAGLWRNGWFPEKGATLTAGLHCFEWLRNGDDAYLSFGEFSIDDITLSGPPSTVQIKAVSAHIDKSFRTEKKSSSHEQITLKEMAGKYAAESGFSLFYDSEYNPRFERIDQRSESDLGFLDRVCRANGLRLKVTEKRIVIYSAALYDARSPVLMLSPSHPLTGWSFRSKAHDVYSACAVKYWDAETKSSKFHTFTPSSPPPVGSTLYVNARVESLAEAEQRAKKELRAKNKEEVAGDIKMIGEPAAAAGQNVQCAGFGAFDGTYSIEKAVHSVTRSGYTTSLSIKNTLEY
ncbi:phage late control D family protein [Limisalsivibrio acetivorans]|uniref:phage late control D family protein n=1 Tax=Limisalsivibrio acetivorans TaxID=1304888 RepID=UPI0003B51F72|nr:contractile injection system protein, VgrG/Pvc8 family [Limisalsivibrio acetivorans]